MNSAWQRPTTNRVSRPVGVWLLTIFDGLVAGVIPLLTVFAVLGNGVEILPGGTMTAILLAGIGIGVIGAAVGAWQGSDRARIALLALIAIFYGLNMLANFRIATADWVPQDAQVRALATLVRSIFWVAINYWYFLRPQTRAWYRAMSR